MTGTFGSLLRDLRLAQGYTRSRLARAIGDAIGRPQTRSLVEQWENGKRTPAPGTAVFHALRHVLGARAGDMLREAARAERVVISFRGVGRSADERRALAAFQRLWRGRCVGADVADALEGMERWARLPRVPSAGPDDPGAPEAMGDSGPPGM